jgi:putative ABC transport system permease protein
MNSPYVAIVNEAFARAFFAGVDPLGKRLRVMDSYRDKPTEIVGIVRDMRQRDLATAARPEMYFPTTQRCWADAQIVVRTRVDPASMTGFLQRTVAEIDPLQTVSLIRTMESLMDNAMSQRRLQMILLAAFSGVALLLAAVGIYGVMACVVSQRTHEIGVRMSLGAQGHQVLGMVLRQGMRLAVIGIVLGVAGAFALTRLLRSLLYEISPADPLSFTAVPILLASVTLLACWLPARRAAKVNPMEALRYE